jgi:hypothetical protein
MLTLQKDDPLVTSTAKAIQTGNLEALTQFLIEYPYLPTVLLK